MLGPRNCTAGLQGLGASGARAGGSVARWGGLRGQGKRRKARGQVTHWCRWPVWDIAVQLVPGWERRGRTQEARPAALGRAGGALAQSPRLAPAPRGPVVTTCCL